MIACPRLHHAPQVHHRYTVAYMLHDVEIVSDEQGNPSVRPLEHVEDPPVAAVFGLAERDVPEILKYLRDFGYETSAFDAASMFRELDDSRKQELLVALLQMAKADSHLDKSEEELIRKTAAILDLSAADISRMRKG